MLLRRRAEMAWPVVRAVAVRLQFVEVSCFLSTFLAETISCVEGKKKTSLMVQQQDAHKQSREKVHRKLARKAKIDHVVKCCMMPGKKRVKIKHLTE